MKKEISINELSIVNTIIKTVRRSHGAADCPHKGNCLSEDEMFEIILGIVRGLTPCSKS
uniref:Uncharacterized protein n=1 Tax=viral metagenome TaxID=1070528 RepID=A0A6H1ZTL7_9ZZZZ